MQATGELSAAAGLVAAVEGEARCALHLSSECDSGGIWRREMCAIDRRQGPTNTDCAGTDLARGDGSSRPVEGAPVDEALWPALYASLGRLA